MGKGIKNNCLGAKNFWSPFAQSSSKVDKNAYLKIGISVVFFIPKIFIFHSYFPQTFLGGEKKNIFGILERQIIRERD